MRFEQTSPDDINESEDESRQSIRGFIPVALLVILAVGGVILNLASQSYAIAVFILPIAITWGLIEACIRVDGFWSSCIHGTMCCALLYQSILLALLVVLYLEGSVPEYSPCGKSSCSSSSGPTDPAPIVAYHPGGIFNSKYPYYLLCPRLPGECRWGDHTENALPLGYPEEPNDTMLPDITQPSCNSRTGSPTFPGDTAPPPCPFLATERAEDYPDLGYGLSDGYYLGVTTTQVKPCPYIDLGDGGRGVDVCGFCSHYLHLNYGLPLPTKGCPRPNRDDSHCIICADVTLRQTDAHRISNVAILGALHTVAALYWLYNVWRLVRIKRQARKGAGNKKVETAQGAAGPGEGDPESVTRRGEFSVGRLKAVYDLLTTQYEQSFKDNTSLYWIKVFNFRKNKAYHMLRTAEHLRKLESLSSEFQKDPIYEIYKGRAARHMKFLNEKRSYKEVKEMGAAYFKSLYPRKNYPGMNRKLYDAQLEWAKGESSFVNL